ncbi:MAG TPA: helix-turn-helix transcriptional regulator [Caldilinea sp.]|mgnify:CR=1 FL=1|nr:helix-turn-helix transcriptional regulator [Caldilinea sp.]
MEWCNQELRSRGWSQKELADRSGVDTGYLSRILKREKELTFDTGAKLATGFGLESPVPLFVIAELIPPPEDMQSALKAMLTAVFDQLHEEDQETLVWMARSLLAKDESKVLDEKNGKSIRLRKKRPAVNT